jgi:hypothetical protein
MAAMYSVLPNAQKASYVGGDLITFDINADPSLALRPGSIRICGSMRVSALVGGGQIPNPTQVFMNATVGMQSVIDQVSTSCSLKGTIENISDYGRAVMTVRQGTSGQLQSTSTSPRTQELCLPDSYSYFPVFFGRAANDRSTDFALSPMIAVNQTLQHLPFSRTGTITITLILAQSTRALHGPDAAACTYDLQNLQLTYVAAPITAEAAKIPVVLGKTEVVRRQLASASTSWQTNASLAAQKMLGSFILQDDLADPVLDHFKTQNISIAQLGFTLNDGNSLITFRQANQEEIMMNYLFALEDASVFRAALATVPGLNSDLEAVIHGGYGVGAVFPPSIDLSKYSMGMTIDGATVDTGVIGYFVFQGGMAI